MGYDNNIKAYVHDILTTHYIPARVSDILTYIRNNSSGRNDGSRDRQR